MPIDPATAAVPARVRRSSTTRAMVRRISADASTRRPDVVATEEPLEIRLTGAGQHAPLTVAVTMRTPGHDFELAVGYLFTEGLLTSPQQLREVRYCVRTADPAGDPQGAAQLMQGAGQLMQGAGQPLQEYNIVTVELSGGVPVDRLRRATVTSSSCGLCGTDSIEHLASDAAALDPGSGPVLDAALVLTLPDRLRAAQPVFDKTGGLHGVGLFDARGQAVVVREDVGRHNAVDKVIGRRVLDAARVAPGFDAFVLVVSGRVSFEIVQKALVAGITTIVAVGAPTSLAIDAAEQLGITLVGFVNATTANVYTHGQRIG